VEQASEQPNIVPFPLTAKHMPPRTDDSGLTIATRYEFTETELAVLCRWFSAMKYAFPEAEGVMMVNHLEKYSAVGLYTQAGRAPNCLIAKHETREGISFFWSTEFDPPRAIAELAEIINAHIRAIGPPRNEKGWLDPAGWLGVYTSRYIAPQLAVV
jgi:hypothetical protein